MKSETRIRKSQDAQIKHKGRKLGQQDTASRLHENTCNKVHCICTHSLPIKLEKHQKAVIRGEKMKGMADHVQREKCSHQPLFNQVKMLGREHWIIGYLKESAHILGDKGLFG